MAVWLKIMIKKKKKKKCMDEWFKSNTMHLENRQDEFSFHANFNS